MKERAKNNRTLIVTKKDEKSYEHKLLDAKKQYNNYHNKTVFGYLEDVAPKLPKESVDLLFIDPPYNLSKNFGNNKFIKRNSGDYEKLFEEWLLSIKHTLKKSASIYVCCDWKSSAPIYNVLNRHFIIRSRITWEREKGRGAKSNWKNCSEDIWYATVSDEFTFNVDAVKIKRRVLAPYRDNGRAKDWDEENEGKFRITHPSNLWTDITIPFWSMPENTDHPTQKPEKLLAKIILASSNKNDFIFDPFLGSGTTSVVAKKLNRNYLGVELNKQFCYLAEKRLDLASRNIEIQGYKDGIFWERNSLSEQKKENNTSNQSRML